MSDLQADLTNCDREPIHIPGQIQSHGFLIVIDDENIIRFFSANTGSYIKGIVNDITGQPLSSIENLLENLPQADFITQLISFGKAAKNFDQVNPAQVNICGQLFYLVISFTNNYYLLEFEPSLSDMKVDVQKMLGSSITQILADKKLQNLLDNSAVQIKNIIDYDRVMIYRFAKDGHGEVVAEAKEAELDTWLGLHYPASDIPKQARELYKLNFTRLIADVYSTPAKIMTSADNDQPLDLTYSQLRAVSPIHIQYLKNMGVASSFSISLLYKNELWGLIACHNYTPRFIDYKARESSKFIGQILSSALEFRQDEENQQQKEIYKDKLDKLSKYLQKSTSIEDALTNEAVTIIDVVSAGGAVLMYENSKVKLGITPGDEQLDALINWVKNNIKESLYFTDNLSAGYPPGAEYKSIASGVMMIVLSKELGEYVIWFKPEVLQTIKWAGNPEKPVEALQSGLMHLSPRRSFDGWLQTVTGTSESWSIEEINSVTRLKEEILYAVNLKAGAIRLLNEKLKQAYEELDTFSYTISHDLKNPITAIKSYAQLLSLNETIDENVLKVIRRIGERADKMNFLINAVLNYAHLGRAAIEFKNINTLSLIKDIIKDLDIYRDKNNLKISIGPLPDLFGDLTMLSQLFSNLLSNAVKYSQKADPPIIHIEGLITKEEIRYTIKDNGVGIAPEDIAEIFGLFSRMENAKDIEGSGVGLAIVKRIVEKHNGKIWVESKLGIGTTFTVAFNKELALVPAKVF